MSSFFVHCTLTDHETPHTILCEQLYCISIHHSLPDKKQPQTIMDKIVYKNNCYQTPPDTGTFWAKKFPSVSFYVHFLTNIYFSSRMARHGKYNKEAWRLSSLNVLRALERTGLKVSISGIEYLQTLKTPCVIVANHMSMMDTVVIPAIVAQEIPVTFIIKESLMHYPVFKHIMQSQNPIALGRTNPREDLKKVFGEGQKRLELGISVTVFPQTTRGTHFDSKQFNSIGVKLAQKAGVPVLPLALKTDAWTNGKVIKDLGQIHPEIPAHFAFDSPVMAEGNGKGAQQQITGFIKQKLKEWQ